MRITNPPPGHDSLDGVSTSDHHTKFSDADAVSAVVEDTAYGAGWNADTTHAPSQNAVYDILEAVKVSDTAYAGSWNGVTTIPPSKNAVYDKIEALPGPSDTAYAGSWDGVTGIAPSKNAVYDKIQALALGSMTLIGSVVADDDASLTITGLDTSLYETYILYLTNMQPATDLATPRVRFGDSGGIDSGGSDYVWQGAQSGTTNAHAFTYDHNDSEIEPWVYSGAAGTGSGTGEGMSGEYSIHAEQSGNVYVHMVGQSVANDPVGAAYGVYNHRTAGSMHAQIVLTQVYFSFSTGNIDTGRMTVYGLKNS